MLKVKIKDHWVQKLEYKQTDGQMNGRTEAIALPNSIMRSVNMGTLSQLSLIHI